MPLKTIKSRNLPKICLFLYRPCLKIRRTLNPKKKASPN